MYLKHEDKSVEFLERLNTIEETCHREHNGSTTWKEINLLVSLVYHIEYKFHEVCLFRDFWQNILTSLFLI